MKLFCPSLKDADSISVFSRSFIKKAGKKGIRRKKSVLRKKKRVLSASFHPPPSTTVPTKRMRKFMSLNNLLKAFIVEKWG